MRSRLPPVAFRRHLDTFPTPFSLLLLLLSFFLRRPQPFIHSFLRSLIHSFRSESEAESIPVLPPHRHLELPWTYRVVPSFGGSSFFKKKTRKRIGYPHLVWWCLLVEGAIGYFGPNAIDVAASTYHNVIWTWLEAPDWSPGWCSQSAPSYEPLIFTPMADVQSPWFHLASAASRFAPLTKSRPKMKSPWLVVGTAATAKANQEPYYYFATQVGRAPND